MVLDAKPSQARRSTNGPASAGSNRTRGRQPDEDQDGGQGRAVKDSLLPRGHDQEDDSAEGA
jgi:hypothetical protein